MRGNPLTEKSKETILKMYLEDFCSIPEISEKEKISRSTIRFFLNRKKALRSTAESIRLAFKKGRVPSRKGVARPSFSTEWKINMSRAKLKWSEKYAKGVSLKPSGYYEVTKGKDKGRSLHVTIMENKIGRRLYQNECVHHVDQCKTNNDISNLRLMTKSEHSRLHRKLEILDNKIRPKGKNGRFT